MTANFPARSWGLVCPRSFHTFGGLPTCDHIDRLSTPSTKNSESRDLRPEPWEAVWLCGKAALAQDVGSEPFAYVAWAAGILGRAVLQGLNPAITRLRGGFPTKYQNESYRLGRFLPISRGESGRGNQVGNNPDKGLAPGRRARPYLCTWRAYAARPYS